LYPKSSVDPDSSVVIQPGNSKDDLSFWFAQSLDQRSIEIVWVLGDNRAETSEHLFDSLMEFTFAGIAVKHLGKDGHKLFIDSRQDGAPF
jgi:hypothetical protein